MMVLLYVVETKSQGSRGWRVDRARQPRTARDGARERKFLVE
jgi:hypothetical protein